MVWVGMETAPSQSRTQRPSYGSQHLFCVGPLISDSSEANTVDSDCRERGAFRIPRSSRSFLGRMFRLVGRESTRSQLSVCVHCGSRYCSLLSSSTPSRAQGMTWVDTSGPRCRLIRVGVTQRTGVPQEGSPLDRNIGSCQIPRRHSCPASGTGGLCSGGPLRLDRRRRWKTALTRHRYRGGNQYSYVVDVKHNTAVWVLVWVLAAAMVAAIINAAVLTQLN
jgi:hypothetical protein